MQKEKIPIKKEMGGFKRSHVSESLDSDKETLMNAEENQLAIITVAPNQEG